MYTVIWDDHEGIRHELVLDALEDAEIEAAALRGKFDYVDIVLTSTIQSTWRV